MIMWEFNKKKNHDIVFLCSGFVRIKKLPINIAFFYSVLSEPSSIISALRSLAEHISLQIKHAKEHASLFFCFLSVDTSFNLAFLFHHKEWGNDTQITEE